MRDGRPNPDIWGNLITCMEIGHGIYMIVGDKKKGLELPKEVAEESNSVCFSDDVSNAVVADALLEQELITDPKALAMLESLRQLDEPEYNSGFEPPISDIDLEGLELE